MINIQKNNLISLTLIALLAAAGCKSSSTSPSTPSKGPDPAVGSTFTYHVTQYNPDGSIGQQGDQTITVSGVQSSWNGMQNVVQFDNGISFVYGSNGDVTSYLAEPQPFGASPEWVLLPFSGGSGVTVSFLNQLPLENDAMITSYSGADTVTINGTLLSTKKAMLLDTAVRATGIGQSATFTQTVNYWFAPSIGEMTKIETGIFTNAVTNQQTGKTTAVLTSYSLK